VPQRQHRPGQGAPVGVVIWCRWQGSLRECGPWPSQSPEGAGLGALAARLPCGVIAWGSGRDPVFRDSRRLKRRRVPLPLLSARGALCQVLTRSLRRWLRAAACVPAPFRSALRGPDRHGDGTHGRRRQDRKTSVDPTRQIVVPAQESSDPVS